MTKFQRTTVMASVGIIAFFLLLGWAGDIDYTDQIILNMTQEEYDSVKQVLTEQNHFTPTDREIAHWWADNQKK